MIGGAASDGDAGETTTVSPAVHLDAAWLNELAVGRLLVLARDSVNVEEAIQVAAGGEIGLHAVDVQVDADLVARGGSIALGDQVSQ